MEPVIKRTGLKQGLVLAEFDIKIIQIEVLQDGLNWIKGVHSQEFKSYMDVRKLLSEEIWERYELHQMNGHREMIELKKRLTTFRKAIVDTKRPVLFRKKRIG